MFKSVVFKIVLAVVLVVVVIGLGAVAYRAGMLQGLAANPSAEAAGAPAVTYPAYGMLPVRHFFGFSCWGLLGTFLLLGLIFGLIRRLVWGPAMWRRAYYGPWGHRCGHRHWAHGPWDAPSEGGKPEDWQNDVPPVFTEWHRRAHEQPESQKPTPPEKS